MIDILQKDSHNLNLTNDMIKESHDYKMSINDNFVERKIDINKDLELLNDLFEDENQTDKYSIIPKEKKKKKPFKFTY
jgi:hypothetical protein